MLSYAFTTLHISDFENVELEQFDHIHNMFASILSKGIAQQIKHGLHREYRGVVEDISGLRGKLCMKESIRNKLAHKQLLTCEYDELSEDTILNRILKTTAVLLIRHGEVAEEYKNSLKKSVMYFSQVDTVDFNGIRWSDIRFQRNNKTYRMLIGICRLIIEGMLQTTEQGEYKIASFIDEQRMCRLYERFILEYYVREHPELEVSSSQIKWALDDGVAVMLPAMQSDIMLSYREKLLIIDAKYYSHTMQTQYDTHTIHSNNLYQIFTYVKNKSAQQEGKQCVVSGLLLYAGTDESVQPDCSYSMSGNRIGVKTLNLNCEFSEIAMQLDRIVEEWRNV